MSGRAQPAAPATIALAVLPFDNLGSPEDDYFIVGLAEDIVCRLAGVGRLSLIGPNDGGLDMPDDGEVFTSASLDAEFLLRASVERLVNPDSSASIRLVPSQLVLVVQMNLNASSYSVGLRRKRPNRCSENHRKREFLRARRRNDARLRSRDRHRPATASPSSGAAPAVRQITRWSRTSTRKLPAPAGT